MRIVTSSVLFAPDEPDVVAPRTHVIFADFCFEVFFKALQSPGGSDRTESLVNDLLEYFDAKGLSLGETVATTVGLLLLVLAKAIDDGLVVVAERTSEVH